MKNLFKKFRENKKGFTLAELLLVVAIVGILVAISIPVFTAQLGKAREATNNANLRAAKAAAMSDYLTGEKTTDSSVTYKYTTDDGVIGDKGTDTVPTTEVVIGEDTGVNAVSKTVVYKTIYVTITAPTGSSNETVKLYPVVPSKAN